MILLIRAIFLRPHGNYCLSSTFSSKHVIKGGETHHYTIFSNLRRLLLRMVGAFTHDRTSDVQIQIP